MARGLLNIVGPYLEDMEDICPGAGADFLALISDRVSREIRGENI
ncbi:BgTH12-02912 [Blumeria graminis f. sp. triticale]|uniref:Bgt-51073 n=2 Tax=Blumeria graminis TaxID=34373 RepID=A0A9X9MIV1_BLUGR|nr:BgTH12-02912 [Blumeria graminis f. sp. triticale]VDB89233.1 Bgt-51073 [Blumeria graminis f. sp. tritici]